MPVVEVPLLPRLPRAGIGSNLRDRILFPTFEGCPTAGQPDGKYFGSDGTPLRPWCFVGEITEVDAMTHKLHLVATDMEGRRDVHIYCNGEDLEKRLHYQGAQPHIGYTVAVLYASKRELIEGGVGLIVEDVLFMKIIPFQLQDILTANDDFCDISSRICRAPGCARTGPELKRCSGCCAAQYCSKDHQTMHWSTHKRQCGVAAVLSVFTKNWTAYERSGFRSN